MDFFNSKKAATNKKIESITKPSVPDGMWVKCPSCNKTVYYKDMTEYRICPHCDYSARLRADERIGQIADEDTFIEYFNTLESVNPLNFPKYEKKVKQLSEETGLNEAVKCGTCKIDGHEVVLCVMDSHFIMGSMGSVVGEKITRSFELSYEKNLPIIVFTASGGARMQEGIISLMQMSKISAAVKRNAEKGLLYVTVITDPTTGGVTASFASLGDIILAEPRATIGFAGRRVIQGTIKQTLPDDFQTSEFLLEHGFIDRIIERFDMKETLSRILVIHSKGAN